MIETKNTAVGKPLSRADGKAKVTGGARYAAEAPMPNAAHAAIVSSTIAKGTISDLDTTAAEAAPGVILVLTPKNMPKLNMGHGMSGESRPPLSDMNVHFAGQHLAVVVADTPERARHAASLVKVAYAPENPVIALNDPDAKVIVPTQNFGEGLQPKRGNVGEALKAPGLVTVEQTYTTPVETHNPMEMCATTAIWEADDRLTVWDSTQGVSSTHDALAATFGLKPENVRVLCPFVGGGFGCKGSEWPHTVLAAVAAKMAKRPVKLVLTRPQMFVSCGHRPTTEQALTLAADKGGKLVAIRHISTVHGSPVSSYVEGCGMGTSRILYDTPNLEVRHIVHQVDVAPPTYMRAPGESPGTFALESAMDELAYALGMDPVQLRLVNYAEKHPHTGQPWSSKHLRECYELGAEKFGWSRRDPKPGSMRDRQGRRVGWGMATATYPGMKFPGAARIRLSLDPRGGLRAVGAAATQDLGTGTWTIGAQMTASLIGLPIERVKFELGDSDLPKSGVSGGSTTAASVAQALGDASDSLKAALLRLANDDAHSPLAGLSPGEVRLDGDRLVSVTNPSRGVPVAPLVARSSTGYVEGASGQGGTNRQVEVKVQGQSGGENYAANQRKYAFQSFGAHFVEVVIDEPIPRVQVSRVVSVMDIGRVINPKTATSQVIGGVTMGMGMALMEETHYDPRTARPMTANLADYPVCVNPDVHTLEAYFTDIPDVHFNPIGCRGVGEIGITGVAGAIANAVYHATGKRIRDLPITPDKLL